MHRLNVYCNHVYEKYNILPIALTICVRSVRAGVCGKFTDGPEADYMKTSPSDSWAKDHVIMTSSTITGYFEKHGRNSSDRNLSPLAALGYVLMEQKCSIFGLQYKEDPTVMLMYAVAKEALDHSIQDHESTVDTLVSMAKETQNQFKRILKRRTILGKGPKLGERRNLIYGNMPA
ncbi:hypothetical protein BJV82DRAFT_603527 [Fennellomyces sp. T-0311]|nr:hypothetical protein BJV82DRAFT_603527 [Fennellomyces sp. T-0311]